MVLVKRKGVVVMVNIFIGAKNKQIGFKVSEVAKEAIEKHALKMGFQNTTEYILSLIDSDMRESEKNEQR